MAVNINVTEDENSIDINDVNVFTVHVKDLSVPGSIQVSQETAYISEDTVDSITEIRTIDLPAESPTAVSVNEIDATTVTVAISEINVIEVSDNVSIVTAATNAASRKLRSYTGDSIWDQTGNTAHYTDGNVGIGTRVPNHPLDVNGNVNATSFTGTFVGALSSSAQIATDISGALGNISTTVTANQSNITNNQRDINTIQSDINIDRVSIGTNQSSIDNNVSRLDALYAFSASISHSIDINTANIVGNLNLINDQISVSRSLSLRVSSVEAGSTSKTLVSGSSQISAEISGAFTELSGTIGTRLTAVESEFLKPLISSSIQISTEITGAFTDTSASLESRITSVEDGSTSKTLVSGSAQIANEISGAFAITSASIQSRITYVEAGSTSKTLVSGSAQIAGEISGAFDNISGSIQSRIYNTELRLLTAEAELSNVLVSGSSQIATEISGAFTELSSSFESRTNILEGNLGQAVNTTSNVEFNIISASQLRVDNDTQISGDLGIGGTIFGLSGFGVTIDDLRILTGSTQFGSESINTHQFTGSVFVTGSLTAIDTISAPTFQGTFVGALSSSTQIAADISGAFVNTSESFQSRLTVTEAELSNTLISSSAQIATEITGAFNTISSSLQDRLTYVEAGSTNKSLVSGSGQIASEISGAFTELSGTIGTRLTAVESEFLKSLVSGSGQIASEISGAFTDISSSIDTRLTAVESEFLKPLISSSIQISTEITGAFNNISSSLESRITSVESGTTIKSLISSSAQIATDISGAFNNIQFSDNSNYNVVVYDDITKQYFYTGSYDSNFKEPDPVQYMVAPSKIPINLSRLVINDFSDSVSVSTTDGILQLTFGDPTNPYIESLQSPNFNADRFDKEVSDYTLDINYNLYNLPFYKGELSASTGGESYAGVTTFTNGQNVNIDSNFTSYQSGSHIFMAKIYTLDAIGDPLTIEETLDLQLTKSDPLDPNIKFTSFNLTRNAYNEADKEIEIGAIGTITINVEEGNAKGWTAANPHRNTFDTVINVNDSDNITTGTIEEYWNSGTDNSNQQYRTGSAIENFTRVRSLRYKVDSDNATLTEDELLKLNDWSGPIKSGFDTPSQIETVTMDFNPSSEYIYIVYDKKYGNLTQIENQKYVQNEIGSFVIGDTENYKIYRSRTPRDYPISYKIKF